MSYLICDLGNVLLDTYCSYNKIYDLFEKIIEEKNENSIGLNWYNPINSFNEAQSFIKIYNELERLDYCGILNLKDKISDTQAQVWDETIKPNKDMFDWIVKLKKENVKVAYLSNMGFDHLNLLKEKYSEFMDLADVKFMSCEVGAAKPSYIYYNTFLSMHPEFRGGLYLDDRAENIEVGNKFGLESYYFNLEDDSLDIKERLKFFESILDIHIIE